MFSTVLAPVTMLMLYHAGRYFMPRKWSSLAFFGVFVATGIIVFIVLPVQLRFFKSVINGVGSIGKHSSEELESLIPLDTHGKVLCILDRHGVMI